MLISREPTLKESAFKSKLEKNTCQDRHFSESRQLTENSWTCHAAGQQRHSLSTYFKLNPYPTVKTTKLRNNTNVQQ